MIKWDEGVPVQGFRIFRFPWAGSTWIRSRFRRVVSRDRRSRQGVDCRFVLTGLEVNVVLAGADAQQDSQDFQVGDVLCQRRIKASATWRSMKGGKWNPAVKAID